MLALFDEIEEKKFLEYCDLFYRGGWKMQEIQKNLEIYFNKTILYKDLRHYIETHLSYQDSSKDAMMLVENIERVTSSDGFHRVVLNKQELKAIAFRDASELEKLF